MLSSFCFLLLLAVTTAQTDEPLPEDPLFTNGIQQVNSCFQIIWVRKNWMTWEIYKYTCYHMTVTLNDTRFCFFLFHLYYEGRFGKGTPCCMNNFLVIRIEKITLPWPLMLSFALVPIPKLSPRWPFCSFQKEAPPCSASMTTSLPTSHPLSCRTGGIQEVGVDVVWMIEWSDLLHCTAWSIVLFGLLYLYCWDLHCIYYRLAHLHGINACIHTLAN